MPANPNTARPQAAADRKPAASIARSRPWAVPAATGWTRETWLIIAVVLGAHLLLLMQMQTAVRRATPPIVPPRPIMVTLTTPPKPIAPAVQPKPSAPPRAAAPVKPKPPVAPRQPPAVSQPKAQVKPVTEPKPMTPEPAETRSTTPAPERPNAPSQPAVASNPEPGKTAAATASAPGPSTAAISPPRFQADYLQNPAPAYPPLSARRGEQGKVLLRVKVSPQGQALQVELAQSSGFSRLDAAAQEAVRRWRFIPARQGEQAVEAWVIVPVNFQLASP